MPRFYYGMILYLIVDMKTPDTASFPFYAKAAFVLFIITAIAAFVYVSSGIIFPVYYGLLLAMALQPVTAFMMRKKIPEILAIVAAIVFSMVIIIGIIYLLVAQISSFTHDWPQLKENLSAYFDKSINWVTQTFNIKKKQLHIR